MENLPPNSPVDNKNKITVENVDYMLYPETTTAKVTKSENAGKITIKSFVTSDSINYAVQEIEDEAFSDKKIESLSFEPNSQVKRIGNFVFQNSTIKSIDIPNTLEEFGENWSYKVNNYRY